MNIFDKTLMKLTHCKTLQEVSTENNIPLATLTNGLLNLKERLNINNQISQKEF